MKIVHIEVEVQQDQMVEACVAGAYEELSWYGFVTTNVEDPYAK